MKNFILNSPIFKHFWVVVRHLLNSETDGKNELCALLNKNLFEY